MTIQEMGVCQVRMWRRRELKKLVTSGKNSSKAEEKVRRRQDGRERDDRGTKLSKM